jgi:predicted nuclease of restriction endonuclease-like RecB superfamily
MARFENASRRSLEAHVRAGLPFDAPARKLALARVALDRLWHDEVVAAVPPRHARARLFCAAAARTAPAAEVVTRVAAELGATPADLGQALLADIPAERRLRPPSEPVGVVELRLRTNLLLVQRLLERSVHVRLQIHGSARPVIRHAKLHGLICSVTGDPGGQTARLEISGPLALFKKTLVYGRALGRLPPQLVHCDRFYLEADVAMPGRDARLILSTGMPILPAERKGRFDSKLEARFARDLAKATTDWDIVREPEPIPVGRSLIFPDFALVRRAPPHERWYVEIVGFWTSDYLRRKLATLRVASLDRLILCIDGARHCDEQALPFAARVVKYERRIDAQRVLELIDETSDGHH